MTEGIIVAVLVIMGLGYISICQLKRVRNDKILKERADHAKKLQEQIDRHTKGDFR